MIRAARPDDWAAIWPFFQRIVAAGETYAYDPTMTSEQARSLWMAPPPDRTFVAVDGDGDDGGNGDGNGNGTVLGSAKSGPNRPGRGAHVATASFMVDPDSQHRGVGRALGVHVLAQARADGFRSMQFNAVVETNTRAVALWQSLGFTIVGTVPEAFNHPEHGYVALLIMYQGFGEVGTQ
jgi:ribosomal protein S18 acetylase RimI-like enzyme